jgi:hypothetical protein
MSSEEIHIDFKPIEEQIDKYLYEYNLIALRDTLQSVLNAFKIYFNVSLKDVVFAYKDYMSTGVLVTIVLRTGVGLKIKIECDKSREKVTAVSVWYVTD